MFSTRSWMQPLEAVQGVKVTHRIHQKVWTIQTDDGLVVVELNWRTGDMRASLQEHKAK